MKRLRDDVKWNMQKCNNKGYTVMQFGCGSWRLTKSDTTKIISVQMNAVRRPYRIWKKRPI